MLGPRHAYPEDRPRMYRIRGSGELLCSVTRLDVSRYDGGWSPVFVHTIVQ